MRAREGFVALGVTGAVWLAGLGAAHAGEWRYCYAYEDGTHRFAMSAPFQPNETMDRVEKAWRDYLAREGLERPRTGCPLGYNREEIGAAMKGAAAFNHGEGHHIVTLDWPAGDPVAAR